jgi:hypothetical protein
MVKIVEYKTFCFYKPGELDEVINKNLILGWELYGSPYSVSENDSA